MAKKNSGLVVTGQVINIRLEDILVDDTWNVRSGLYQANDKYKLLTESIKAEGVQDPVEVVLAASAGFKTDKPYVLIAGFRRTHIAQELGLETIPAMVTERTPVAARLRNLQENSNREDVNTADLCWGVKQLGDNYSVKEISERMALSFGWVSTLKNIGSALSPKVLAAWRATNVKIPVKDIKQVASVPVDKQEEFFASLVKSTAGAPATPRTKWLDTACKRATQYGHIFGQLAQAGYVSLNENDSSRWEPLMGKILGQYSASAKPTAENNVAIIHSFLLGVETGRTLRQQVPVDVVEMNAAKVDMCPSVADEDSVLDDIQS